MGVLNMPLDGSMMSTFGRNADPASTAALCYGDRKAYVRNDAAIRAETNPAKKAAWESHMQGVQALCTARGCEGHFGPLFGAVADLQK